MMRRIPIALAIALTATLLGCTDKADPTEPKGGYLEFRDALFSGDPALLWVTLSTDSQQLYGDALEDLQAISETTRRLAPSDRVLVEERTALQLLAVADDAESLFIALARMENLAGDETYRIGSEIESLVVDSDGEHATVTTAAGQTVTLVKEEDGIWRVNSLAELIQRQLSPITQDVMTVEVMASDSVYMQRSPEEIQRLLGGE